MGSTSRIRLGSARVVRRNYAHGTMKRPGYIITVSLFAIFAIADIVHDFITNDPVSYFSQQPRQLLVVVAVAIVGGLVTFFLYRLSTHWQRRIKLIVLGFTAGFATFAGPCFSLSFGPTCRTSLFGFPVIYF